jgi:rubrerythrin
MTAGHDIAMVREALRLEREAAARYEQHPAASSDPRLVTYWESLRRNEASHRELLEGWLRAHGESPDAPAPPAHPGTPSADPDAATKGLADTGAAEATVTETGRHPLPPGKAATPGHATDLFALRSDYEFEDEAVVIYGRFAYQAEDRELMELFKELARAESGHRNGLRRTVRALEGSARPVVFFCPLCGWEIDFGPGPAEGAERKCPMCPGRFALRLDVGGDWTLERLAP